MPDFDSAATETHQPDAVGARWIGDEDYQWRTSWFGSVSDQDQSSWVHDQTSSNWEQVVRDALAETSSEATPSPRSDPIARLDDPRSVRNRMLRTSPYPAVNIEGRFHGVVLDVFEDSFAAQVVNGNPDDPPLVAEFPIAELPSDDQKALAPGSAFHITVATDRGRPGRPTRISAIRLQRFRAWPAEEVEAARVEARALADLLEDEFDDD